VCLYYGLRVWSQTNEKIKIQQAIATSLDRKTTDVMVKL